MKFLSFLFAATLLVVSNLSLIKAQCSGTGTTECNPANTGVITVSWKNIWNLLESNFAKLIRLSLKRNTYVWTLHYG
jgi:hypothetical protein